MRILEAKAKHLREEMERGRGGDRLCASPVSLELPFVPFVHNAQGHGEQSVALTARQSVTVADGDLSFLSVRVSAEDDFNQELAEQLILALHPSNPLAFEVIVSTERGSIQIAGTSSDVAAVSQQILAHYPSAEVSPSSDLLREGAEKLSSARTYRLRESHLFEIRKDHAAEPYAALLGLANGLGANEYAVFQVLFVPARHDWRRNILEVSHSPWDPKRSAFVDLPHLPKAAERKVARPLFAVTVRFAASNADLVNRMEGCFLPHFEVEENGFRPLAEEYPIESILKRTTHSHGMILNATELAALIHLPSPEQVPEMLVPARMTAPPPSLATENILVPLGINRHRGSEKQVGIPEEWLTRHVAIFGGTGYGKTNLLKLFLKVVERGYGLAFLDPAGDAAKEFLELIPKERIEDVIYFDPADREYPPALNVLVSSDREQEMLTSELMVALKRLFRGASEFGPRMEWILRQAIRTLLASRGEKTLRHIPRLLSSEEYRRQVLETVDDPDLLWFWQTRSFPANAIDPILNRLSGFLDRPTIRNIVSQPNRIDFHRVLREGKILVCNLSKGILGEEAATLLGSFILTKLQLATMARAELPPSERKLFLIIVDELQNYAGRDSDTAGIRSFLTEARKFRVSLVTATQFLSQLDREITTAILGNAGTLVCLRLGLVDAQMLERELDRFEVKDLLNLGTGEALVRMGSARSAFNVSIPEVTCLQRSFAEAIISRSRRLYCRPREEVEYALRDGILPGQRDIEEPLPLSYDERSFLERVALYPDEMVTEVAKALGFSGYKAARIRNHLSVQGLLVEVETRLGRGGTLAKFAVPTLHGFQALGREPYHGRGGPIHRHFQRVISERARRQGYTVDTEHHIGEGNVDIHLEGEEGAVAVELSVTSSAPREIKNIKKCLAAGYRRIVVLFLDDNELKKARVLAKDAFSKEEAERINFGSLVRFDEIL